MRIEYYFSIIVILIPMLLNSQDWIGIGSGASHMEIKGSSVWISNGSFQKTLINIGQDSIGEFKGIVMDPDTGEDKYEILIEIFKNRDSIKYKSIKGKVYNTFYKGNKFKRKYPFKFYSICLEAFDQNKLVNRYEIRKCGRFEKNKYGSFEYNQFDKNIRLVKELELEIIELM